MQEDFYNKYNAKVKLTINEIYGDLNWNMSIVDDMLSYLYENIDGVQTPLNAKATDEDLKSNGIFKPFD